MSKVIVIGGGASGIIAAITSSKKNDVVILERNSTCAKKILMTGNGKCNYWNKDLNINHYNSTNIELLDKIINEKNTKRVLDFFDGIGIVPNIKNGYYYPYSNQAISIKEALLLQAKLSGVKIINNCLVKNIIKEKNIFEIETNIKNFKCDKLIISTGSMACPKTGSDGVGYELLKNLNHKIIKPLPALVQLKGNEKYFKDWAGIRCEVLVQLKENNKLIREEKGEIQLTDYGVSGICIMQLSGRVAIGLDKGNNEKIVINFAPQINNFIKWMELRNQKVRNRIVTQLLDGIFNYNLVNLFIKLSDIDKNKSWDELTIEEKNKLNKQITSFELKIVETNSFDKAQVCSGGVKLNEININTLESLLVKNLYITGELLDVNGDCGGYNLAFAFTTGFIAGESTND